MKLLHKDNLFCWSQFDEARNIDFHSYLWVREQGNIVFDPLPISQHDIDHLQSLGGVRYILISNSDHIREAESLAKLTNAEIWGPEGEKENFPIRCSTWLSEKINVIEGLDVYSLSGSKTEGELAFVIDGETLITGDLIRAHSGGELCMLPKIKLQDVDKARDSVIRMASIPSINAILPGDGWPVFRNGDEILAKLITSIKK